MKKTNVRKKGFTLIELIIVIAILALLAAVALPRYSASRQRAAVTAHNTNVRILKAAGQNYYANEGSGTDWTKESHDENYVEEWPEVPDGVAENATGYTVSITDDGSVTVTPKSIDGEQSE